MSANEDDLARTLLKCLPALQRPCDLDLLVFSAKHPRTLMSNEQLAQLLGYQLNEIARSLDALLAADFLRRTQNPARLARMYVFAAGGTNGGSLQAVVEFASTREGRLALRRALTHSPAGGRDGLATQAEDVATAPAGGADISGSARTGDDPRTVVG
jgi:hypothetical protein